MMKKFWIILLGGLALGCGEDIAYRPTPQILPPNIKRICLRPVVNKTQQFGLEDKLSLAVRDQFLSDGRYPIVPEADSDGIVLVTVTRYILTPIKFDSKLVPTNYKLHVIVDLQFIDRASNTAIWEEPIMEGILTYADQTLPGGLTEELAREQIWAGLASNIVKRVIDGYGTVTGSSERRISPDAPSTPPSVEPNAPIRTPVVPNPY